MKRFAQILLSVLTVLSFILTASPVVQAKQPAEQQATKQSNKIILAKKAKSKKISKKQARRERLRKRRLAMAKRRATELGEHYDGSESPQFFSNHLIVVNQKTGDVKFSKNANKQVPIASITKLMTAMVVLDSGMSLEAPVTISEQDVDTIKRTRSRLPVGTTFSREDMLKLALISSENRAAYALSRHYPGGRAAFIKAMNAKARALGLMHTHFAGPTGLMAANKSTAQDLYQLVAAAYQYPFIRKTTTTPEYEITVDGKTKPLKYKNTNVLVRKGEWDIGLSKTGFINEAGRCIVMQANIANEPYMMVFLDAAGTNKRTGDAYRVRKRIEYELLNPIHTRQPEVQLAKQQSPRIKKVYNHQQALAELTVKEAPTAVEKVKETTISAPKLVMTQTIFEERYDQWLQANEQ